MANNSENQLNSFAYWVVKGKLAAGEYPGNQLSFRPSTTLATNVNSVSALLKTKLKDRNTPSYKIGNLMECGISSFIDLTEAGERPDYQRILHIERRRRSLRSEYYRFPLVDREVPDLDEVVVRPRHEARPAAVVERRHAVDHVRVSYEHRRRVLGRRWCIGLRRAADRLLGHGPDSKGGLALLAAARRQT